MRCFSIILLIAIMAMTALAQDLVVLDQKTINCSTEVQETSLWFQPRVYTTGASAVAAGGEGWTLLHEFKASASGTVELKYTELYPDFNDNSTVDEYDDNDWTTLETARTYDTSTNLWFHHALTVDACYGVLVYTDHSDATGTHTIYLIGHQRD